MNGIKSYANGLAVQQSQQEAVGGVSFLEVYDSEGVVHFLLPNIDETVDDRHLDIAVGNAQKFGFLVERAHLTFGETARSMAEGDTSSIVDGMSSNEISCMGMVTESMAKVLTDKFMVEMYNIGTPTEAIMGMVVISEPMMTKMAAMLISGGAESLELAALAAKNARAGGVEIVPDFSPDSWVAGCAKMVRWPGLTAAGSNDDCDCPMCRARRNDTCEGSDN